MRTQKYRKSLCKVTMDSDSATEDDDDDTICNYLTVSPTHANNDRDKLVPSINAARALFKQDNSEIFPQFVQKLQKENPSLYDKIFNAKKIQQLLNEECNASDIESCIKIADSFKQNDQNSDNKKPNKSFDLLPEDLLGKILRFAIHYIPINSELGYRGIPFINFEIVCLRWCEISRKYLYRNIPRSIYLSGNNNKRYMAILTQYKYKDLDKMVLKANGSILTLRTTWYQSLTKLEIDFGQFLGIKHPISVKHLIINSHHDERKWINIHSMKETGIQQYFDTRHIMKLQINCYPYFTDLHLMTILNCDYNNLESLTISGWTSTDCELSPPSFNLSNMRTPNLIDISIFDGRDTLKNINELTNNDTFIYDLNELCTKAWKKMCECNCSTNLDNELYLQFMYDTFGESIRNRMGDTNNHNFVIINDFWEFMKPPTNKKISFLRDQKSFFVGSKEITWDIKIKNINNKDTWSIAIGIESATIQNDNFSRVPKLQFQGPNKNTMVKKSGGCNYDKYKDVKLKNDINEITMKLKDNKLSFTINTKDYGHAIYYNNLNIGNVTNQRMRATIRIRTSDKIRIDPYDTMFDCMIFRN